MITNGKMKWQFFKTIPNKKVIYYFYMRRNSKTKTKIKCSSTCLNQPSWKYKILNYDKIVWSKYNFCDICQKKVIEQVIRLTINENQDSEILLRMLNVSSPYITHEKWPIFNNEDVSFESVALVLGIYRQIHRVLLHFWSFF